MEFICKKCGKLFKSNKYDKNRTPKYCSKICFQLSPVLEDTKKKQSEKKLGKIPWNKGIKMWENKKHPRGTLGKLGLGKGKKVSDETKEKQRQSHIGIPLLDRRGKKHHWWKGGITEINMKQRKSIEYKNWRRKVFERDKYTCVLCKKIGGYLQADHIKPFSIYIELRYEIDNGRTLCCKCHKETETFGSKIQKYKKVKYE